MALILVALFLVLSLCALLLFLFLRPADPRKPFPLTIDYPLERPYPLPAIVTPEQMADYYPLILDDSLLRVLATASWHPDGWRGLTLADGQYAYIDSTLLYSLPYLSARERHLRDSLIRREIATLHPSQRHLSTNPLSGHCHSIFHFCRSGTRRNSIGRQYFANAIIHSIFLYHGWFCLFRRSVSGEICWCQ